MGDAPELHLARPDHDGRIDLPVDGNDLALAKLHVFDEQELLWQIAQDWKMPL